MKRLAVIAFIPLLGVLAFPRQDPNRGLPYYDTAWLSGKWSEDDAPYAKARTEIEQLASDGTKLGQFINKLQMRCGTDKATSMDLFRWSTAVLTKASTFDEWRKIDNDREAKKPYSLFSKLSRPKSYEFTRARFLFTVKFDFAHHNLLSGGERLLAHRPNDVSMMRAVLRLYQPQAYPAERSRGEELARRLEVVKPGELTTLTTIAAFYHRCWMRSKSSADANAALIRSEQALRLTKSAEQARIIKETMAELRGK